QSRDYYSQLYDTKLDPLGLAAFPTDSIQYANPPNKPVVVFFGDSRAADWPAPPQLENITFINRGIGNQTSAQALGRLPHHVIPLKPDVVLIQIGINDLKTIPLFPAQKASIIANCKANIGEIVRLSIQSGARVILTTIFPLGQVPVERRLVWSDDIATSIDDVNGFITQLKGNNVEIFDAGKILGTETGTLNPLYSKDLLHLNEKGYGVLNRELIHILTKDIQ
ncbi:MAG TPA: GDSL-type esterase/lipase family protein, partial [Anaerolineae bacterium]